MSTGASRSEDGGTRSAGTAPAAAGGTAAAKGAAVVLWVLVSGGLLYGVVQTVQRASQLFGG